MGRFGTGRGTFWEVQDGLGNLREVIQTFLEVQEE